MLRFFICNLLTVIILAHPHPSAVEKKEKGYVKKAEEIMMKMTKNCVDPTPKLFPVDSIYPLSNVKYRPHCVILHRCDEDAGCCNQNDKICAPAEIEIIQIHVFAIQYKKQKVYEMTFENHTRCECKNSLDLSDETVIPIVRLQ